MRPAGTNEYDRCGVNECEGTLRQHFNYDERKRVITCDKCSRYFEEGRHGLPTLPDATP